MVEKIEKLEKNIRYLWISLFVCFICMGGLIFMVTIEFDDRFDNEYMNTRQIEQLHDVYIEALNNSVQMELLLIDAILYNQERLTVIEEMLYIEYE